MKAIINKKPYYVCEDEFNKIDHKEYQNLRILNNVGKYEKLISFAGIYDRWISPEGEIRESAAIITRDAVGQLAKVHNRMPVCMPKNRWDDWLDSKLNDANQLRSLMQLKEPDANLRFWPVSNRVNSIRNNGAELIAPEVIGPAETLF